MEFLDKILNTGLGVYQAKTAGDIASAAKKVEASQSRTSLAELAQKNKTVLIGAAVAVVLVIVLMVFKRK